LALFQYSILTYDQFSHSFSMFNYSIYYLLSLISPFYFGSFQFHLFLICICICTISIFLFCHIKCISFQVPYFCTPFMVCGSGFKHAARHSCFPFIVICYLFSSFCTYWVFTFTFILLLLSFIVFSCCTRYFTYPILEVYLTDVSTLLLYFPISWHMHYIFSLFPFLF